MSSVVVVFYFTTNTLPWCFAGFFPELVRVVIRCGRELSLGGLRIPVPWLALYDSPTHQQRSPRDVCPGNEGVRPCPGGASRRIANESALLKVELQQSR